jgi:hypothetical protein
MFLQSFLNVNNIIQNSKYIVYTNQGKFDRARIMDRKIVSNTLEIKEFDAVYKIFEGSDKLGIISHSDKFLDFYRPKQIQNLCVDFETDIFAKLHKKPSSKMFKLEQQDKDIVVGKVIDFCLSHLSDLIIIDLDKPKTFISHNSYYLTNQPTKEELDNFPITQISDEEILQRITYDFKGSIEEQATLYSED